MSQGGPSGAATLPLHPIPLPTTEEEGKAIVSTTLYPAPAEHLVGGEFLLRTTTRFFDREDEMARLERLLSGPRTRLVTLTGAGGSGKTRLALEVAAHLVEEAEGTPRDNGPGRAVFVSLAEVSDAERLFEVILWALGVLPDRSANPLDQLGQTLDTQPYTLLVLDNFEQLAAEGALRIRDLLAKAAGVKLLVTSRQTLDLEGEQIFHLSALPTRADTQNFEALLAVPSVALFVDRAQAILPDFQLTERNAAIVAQLCDYLEGLPLAIELAAARVALLSPARILEQVQENRLDFLTTRRRDAASRQRTLRATLDWSYRLLPEAGQQLLGALSVCRGGWTLEAAEAIVDCRLTIDNWQSGADLIDNRQSTIVHSTLELLTLLRDSSLIDVWDTEDGLRFTMLATVREYAVEQLERSGEKETVCRRHAAHFIGVMESVIPMLDKPGGLQTLRQIGREQANFRAARAWIETHPQDPLNGRLGLALIRAWNGLNLQQVARWLTRVRVPGGDGEAETVNDLLANLLLALSGMTDKSMDPGEAMVQLRQIADLFGQQKRPVNQAWTLISVGYLASERNLPEARAVLEEAVARIRQIGNAIGLASALTMLAYTAGFQGEYERADALNAEALTLLQDRQDTLAYGQALLIEGHNRLIRGDLVCAQTYFEQNLALRRRIGDRPGEGVALMYLGRVDLDREDFNAAALRQEEALTFYEQTHWEASFFADAAFCYLARARLGLGEVALAAVLAGKALDRFSQRKSRYGCQKCFNLLAEIAAARGQDMRAARLLGAGERMRARLGLVMFQNDHDRIEPLRSSLMARLGEARFTKEMQEGQALSEDEALEMALAG